MEIKARLGMYAGFGFHVPFEERMALIAEAGFDCTSLWWEHKNEGIRKLKHLAPGIARQAGLEIESIHVPYSNCNDLWSADEATRNAALDQHCQWIDDCNQHEIPIMVMHVTLGRTPPPVSDAGLESYANLIDYAEQKGVTVAIENVRSNEYLDVLFEQFDTDTLGLCYDISHDVLYSETPGELLQRHGSRLVSTHLADTDGILDRHWLPGRGSIDYQSILTSFPEAYTGALVLEVTSKKDENLMEEFVLRAYSALIEHIVNRTKTQSPK